MKGSKFPADMHNYIWCPVCIPRFMIIGSVVSEELRWQDFGTDGQTDRVTALLDLLSPLACFKMVFIKQKFTDFHLLNWCHFQLWIKEFQKERTHTSHCSHYKQFTGSLHAPYMLSRKQETLNNETFLASFSGVIACIRVCKKDINKHWLHTSNICNITSNSASILKPVHHYGQMNQRGKSFPLSALEPLI